jgi:RimJ/RimL family protein N-acetyltransferase
VPAARVEIETPRLRLRQWAIDDWKLLHRAYGDPEVARWIGTDPSSPEWTAYAVGRMTNHWDLMGFGSWALEELDSGEFVGRAGLSFQADWPVGDDKVEVGWTLVRAFWGRGYATEAALASLSFGFGTLELPRIISLTTPDNVRSRAVMERCGMREVATATWRGHEHVSYAIDRPQWPPAHVRAPEVRIMPA